MLEPKFVPLFYLSSLTGLIMVLGSIWLIYKQKIYIDRESKQVTSIETPFGKFQTNLPAILLFVIGFIFLGYPILKVSELTRESAQTLGITGEVDSNEEPVIVYAVVAEQAMGKDRLFRLTVPVPRPAFPVYTVLVQSGNTFDRQNVLIDLSHKAVSTRKFIFEGPPSSGQGETGTDFVPDTVSAPAEFGK